MEVTNVKCPSLHHGASRSFLSTKNRQQYLVYKDTKTK